NVAQRLVARDIGAGGLRVEPKAQRARVTRTETLASDARRKAPPRTELRDLLEEADRHVEEEAEAPQEDVGVASTLDQVVRILDCRGQRQAHGLRRCRTGLLRMLTDDRQRIPSRYVRTHPVDVVEQHALLSGHR